MEHNQTMRTKAPHEEVNGKPFLRYHAASCSDDDLFLPEFDLPIDKSITDLVQTHLL